MAQYTRREAVTLLLSALPTLSLANLVACQCTTGDPDGDDTDSTGDTPRERPELDAERLSAAIASVLAASPWAGRIDELLEGAQAEIAVLRENGLDNAADIATYGMNGILANVSGGIGENMALRGANYDYSEICDALIGELGTSCVAMRAVLPDATDEIRGVLGSDTVPAMDEVATTMAEDEATARQLMHERELNDQAQLNFLLGQQQSVRADYTNGFSLAAASAKLDSMLSGLAPDEEVALWMRLPHAAVPLRPIGPPAPPPPPGHVEDNCDIWEWISFFIGWMKTLHSAGAAATQKMAEVLDELPEAFEWARDGFNHWLTQAWGDELAEQTKDTIAKKMAGEAVTASREQCNWIAAFIVVVLWFATLAATLAAFVGSMSWAAGFMAGASGGLIALVFILMLLIICFYVLEMICAVVDILDTMDQMLTECG